MQSAIVSLKPRRWLWPLYDASGAPTRLRLLRLKSVICNTCESFTTISPPFSALRHQHRATIRWLYLCYHFLFGTPAPMGTKAVQNLEVIRHRSIRFGTDQTSYQRARSSTPKLLTCAPCRQQELSVALYKRGISFKDESTLCKDYVARGQPSVHFIVEKLMQSHIAHEHSVVDYFIDRETIFAGSSGAYLPEHARLQELERLGRELFHHVILQGGYGKPNTCTCGLPLIKSYISRNRERLYVLFHMRSNDFLHLIGSLINADSTRLDARIGAQDQLYNLYAAVQHRSALSLRFRCHMQVVAISDVAFIARLRSLSHSFLSTFLNSTASIPRVRER